MRKKAFSILLAFIAVPLFISAQYTPWYYWTFLPKDQMHEIIGEASGETAYGTIMETGGYTRNRPLEEYRTTFRESEYIHDKLQQYGVPGAKIVRMPAASDSTWNGIRGDLWEVTPGRQKIVSYTDNVFQLTQGSNSADVIAELVWVGSGSTEEVREADVEGKIAVGHGNVTQIHNNAVLSGAEGVLAISTSRNYFDPLQIPQGRIRSFTDPDTGERIEPAFAFQMNIREGQYLRSRLLRGEKIIAHAQVETSMEPYELQNVEALIPGKNPDEIGVIFSAHIFEGLVKQGANDNKSGGAAILEVARVLNRLIEDGRLPRPERSIMFWWGPEFSGSRPWVAENFEDIKGAYCNINMDMVGEWLSLNNAYFCLMRTTFGNAHYVNDVVENYYRFVGEGNRERIQNRRDFDKVPHRIVAPFGADEPFHYSIETHYGASDHVVFNNFGVQIPGVMMIAWPDQWYHTSGDLVDKSDPTQLKRTAVIGAAAAYTIANADDGMALKIAGEISSNATRRLGHQLVIAMEKINSANAGSLAGRYKDAVSLVEAHVINEKATLESVYELASERRRVADQVESLKLTVERVGEAHLDALEVYMTSMAARLGTDPVTIALTELEEKADAIIPALVPEAVKMGPAGLSQYMSDAPEEELEKYPIATRIDMTEIARLINGENSVYTIKKMIDAQQEGKSELNDILNYVERLRVAGVVEFI